MFFIFVVMTPRAVEEHSPAQFRVGRRIHRHVREGERFWRFCHSTLYAGAILQGTRAFCAVRRDIACESVGCGRFQRAPPPPPRFDQAHDFRIFRE